MADRKPHAGARTGPSYRLNDASQASRRVAYAVAVVTAAWLALHWLGAF